MGSDDFVPWRWLRKRELGNKPTYDEKTSIYNQLYLSMEVVNSFEPYKTTNHSHHGGIFNFDYSTDGSILVAACEKQSILMFDPFNGKLVDSKDEAHEDCVNCVRFLDTRVFATCSDDTTVALWDARYLKQKIRTFHGHSNWVKNIEYASGLGLLVTSGFDGSIFTWDINSYSNEEYVPNKVFHTGALMRSKLSPDNSQLVISTAVGYLIIIHNLDLHTLAEDLRGFKPTLYRQMQISQLDNALQIEYNHVFQRTRNRVEFISDFPKGNQAEVISSLQIHPQGWCAVSRNTNAKENSEWTCVHDIQTLPKPDKEDLDSSSDKEVPEASCSTPDNVQTDSVQTDTVQTDTGQTDSSPATQSNGPHREFYVNSLENLGRSINRSRVSHDLDDEDDDVDSQSSDEFPLIMDNGFGNYNVIHFRPANDPSSSPSHQINNSSISEVARSETTVDDVMTPPFHFHNSISLIPFPDIFKAPSLLRRHPRKKNKNVCQNRARLLAFSQEPNVGRGFIKELCFSADGRLICSPFGHGVRLLAFDPSCKELCDNVPSSAVQLYELGSTIAHSDVVVTTKFSPVHCLYVSGCLSGKIAFNQPRL